MSQELRKKAVEMLLAGATLVAEPCPYCRGVRVIKDGNALCISCGREPDKNKIAETAQKQELSQNPVLESLNKKLGQLTAELELEKDHEKQQQILKSINSLIETIQKLKK
ncbi:MAG: Sjogren's syndrome/scleroderma autoantigen 1 family protein [Thermoproteota archaeon]